MRPEAIGTIFESLCFAMQEAGPAGASLTMDWQAPEDTVVEGDLIPVMTLSLRPATLPDVNGPVAVQPSNF